MSICTWVRNLHLLTTTMIWVKIVSALIITRLWDNYIGLAQPAQVWCTAYTCVYVVCVGLNPHWKAILALVQSYVSQAMCKFLLSLASWAQCMWFPVHLTSSKSCYILPMPCSLIHSEPSSQLWFGDMNQPIGLCKHKAALLPGW